MSAIKEQYHDQIESGMRQFCCCEMPAKMKGKNLCWRCKKPFKKIFNKNLQ